MELERLLDQVYSEEIVQSRERLEPWIPELRKHLPHLWTAVFDRCTTRFNKYLFLNAPELWTATSAADWLAIMSSPIGRTYRPPDVFDTGRFDDVRLLHRYVGVDSLQLLFRGSAATPETRDAVTRHALAFPESYLPDEWDDALFEDSEVHTSRATLETYRDALRRELGWLGLAASDAPTLTARLRSYAGE